MNLLNPLILQSGEELSSEETAVAIVAIIAFSFLITVVASIATWQLIGAWRTRMAVGREQGGSAWRSSSCCL